MQGQKTKGIEDGWEKTAAVGGVGGVGGVGQGTGLPSVCMSELLTGPFSAALHRLMLRMS